MTTNSNQNITLEEFMRQEGHVSAFPTEVNAKTKEKANTQIDYSALEPYSVEEDLDIPTLHPEAQAVEETNHETPIKSDHSEPQADTSAIPVAANNKDKMIHELQKEVSQLREQVRVLRKESSHQKNCNKALRSILKQSGLLEDPNAKSATKGNWIGSLVSSFKH